MYDPLLVPELREMLLQSDTVAMREFCNVLHPGVAAENLEELPDEELWTILSQAEVAQQAEIFSFLKLPRQVSLVDRIDNEHLTTLLEAMASDDRVDLLGALDEDHVERLLPLIAQAERADVRRLLSYPENSVGSLMTTDYASLPERISAREALNLLRTQAPDRETIYYVYILDEGRHLQGFVSLRKLILARPETPVDSVMDHDVISLRVDDDIDVAVRKMSRYDFIAMPVVDDQNRLVGIVTHDDVLDVVQEEATETVQRMGAMQPLEDQYLSTPLHTLAWKRGVWLVLLLVAGFGTSAILRSYDRVSERYEWLIWFLPLVLASGGNAGSQSATLIIRTLALGEFGRSDALKIVRKEVLTGLILGLTLALLGFLFAWQYRTLMDAAVVGTTLLAVVTFGTFNGSVLPMILRRMGMDPAIMSNPLIASLSDAAGVLIYYTVAMLALGWV
jgi:magnesium transporter